MKKKVLTAIVIAALLIGCTTAFAAYGNGRQQRSLADCTVDRPPAEEAVCTPAVPCADTCPQDGTGMQYGKADLEEPDNTASCPNAAICPNAENCPNNCDSPNDCVPLKDGTGRHCGNGRGRKN